MSAWADLVPRHMRDRRQWVRWADVGDQKKVPFIIGSSAKAKSNDPGTWRAFADAAKQHEKDPRVGYVLTDEDGLVFIDGDDCLDERGTLKPWAVPLVRPFLGRTYVERSPSGRGLHLFVRARLPDGARSRYPVADGAIELYARGRYSTITADPFGEHREIEAAQADVDALVAALTPERPPARVVPLRRPERAPASDADAAVWALQQLDPDAPYDMWIRVGMALHSAWPDERGLDAWDWWSARGTKYRGRRDLETHWRSFRRSGVTLGTLIALGKKRGTP